MLRSKDALWQKQLNFFLAYFVLRGGLLYSHVANTEYC